MKGNKYGEIIFIYFLVPFQYQVRNSIMIFISILLKYGFHSPFWKILNRKVVVITISYFFFTPEWCTYETPRQVYVWVMVLRWPGKSYWPLVYVENITVSIKLMNCFPCKTSTDKNFKRRCLIFFFTLTLNLKVILFWVNIDSFLNGPIYLLCMIQIS